MSKCIKCDCCKRTTPEVQITFRKRKENWSRFWFDSQGGSFQRLDICDYCWDSINKIIKDGIK